MAGMKKMSPMSKGAKTGPGFKALQAKDKAMVSKYKGGMSKGK